MCLLYVESMRYFFTSEILEHVYAADGRHNEIGPSHDDEKEAV